jgi:uncharacterized iron-regulated membrane protein
MYLGRIFLAVIGFLCLIFLVIILFAGGGGKKPIHTNPIEPLPSYASTDAQVIMTIDGAINGDDTHRAIRVTVDQNSRELDVIQGYSDTVIQNNPNYNTKNAYSAFLSALDVAGFTVQRKGPAANISEAGQCPLGQRINFELQQDGNVLLNSWTTSCSAKNGNLGGNSQLLQQLFENQITNYETLTDSVNLN